MTRLHLERIRQAAAAIDPVFLNTPQFPCEPLGAALGVSLWLKVETLNPIRSFKGRGADWLVRQAPEDELYAASAGNFGQALAYACRARGKRLTVYAAENANRLKVSRMRELGATVVSAGRDFDAAKEFARQAAAQRGVRFVEDGRDVETAEGAGTIGLELAAIAARFDTLLVPLGNGAFCAGIAHALRATSPPTRCVAVQAAGAPAMLESWRAGRIVRHERVDTIADGIAVREPIPEALDDLRDVLDDGLCVSEAAIVAAMRLVHRHAGVVVEPSGAVGVAALLEAPDRFRGGRVATILCGGNLAPESLRDLLLSE